MSDTSPAPQSANPLHRLVRRARRLFQPTPGRGMNALRDDIAGAIAIGHSGGAMEKDARDRLLGALDLTHRTVDEIMRHRRQIEMIDADLPPGEIITRVLASPYTRLPIYRDSDDNILGVVHAKDLLREVDRLVRGEEALGILALDIVKVAMKPYFIPETTTLDEQMREFLARRTHFALVVDEYGALQGLITLEDILEEIVGEITDEFDVVRKDSGLTRLKMAPAWWTEHDDPRSEPRDRLAPAGRRGQHHRGPGHSRSPDDPERRSGLQLPRLPLRGGDAAREPDHPAEAAPALTRGVRPATQASRLAPRAAQSVYSLSFPGSTTSPF